MKKLIFAIVVLMIFPLTVFSWTDTTGSTDTATVDYDIKDMLNNSYDRSTGMFQVETEVSIPSVTVTIDLPDDYPDSAAEGSLSNIDTNTSNIYSQMKSSSIVVDQSYVNKVSTGTAGKLIISGNIVLTIFMDAYSFYSLGGDSEITSTFMNGIMYALDGIPIDFKKLSRPISSPTFQCALAANTTLYYIINGVR